VIIPIKSYQNIYITFNSLFFISTLILILLVTVPSLLHAQERPDFRKIDSLSYALYQQKNWDELIEAGEYALKHGVDYYYLQMRVGVAWYEKGKFRQAIPRFETALKYNDQDQTAMEYLYYCYLYSGRQYDIRRLMPRLNKSTTEKMGINGSGILEEIYVEGGPVLTDNQKTEINWGHTQPFDTIYNSAYLYNNNTYFHFGARFNIHPNISTYQGYSSTKVPFTQKIRYQDMPLEDFTYTTHQNEYYGNLEIGLPNGIKILPAWNFIWYKFDNREVGYDSVSYALTVDTATIHRNEYVVSLSIKKDLPKFAIELNGTYGDFSETNQAQLGLTAFAYPFGNLNFYTQTSFVNVWQSGAYSPIFYQMVGGRLANRIWLEGNFTIGNLTNYAENNAFIIYNAPEKINFKFETVFIYSLNKHLEFSLRYRLLQRESEYFYYATADDYYWSTTKYLYHTIIGGIKWQL
jgi:hypothetical protein